LQESGDDMGVDRIRLLCLATDTVDGGTFVYLIDCFAVDPSALWEALAEKDLVLHNAVFDLGFLARMNFCPKGRLHDTMLLSQVLCAGRYDQRHRLSDCAERELGRQLDKTEQVSDWSAPAGRRCVTSSARSSRASFTAPPAGAR
jgi:hypothetical protein